MRGDGKTSYESIWTTAAFNAGIRVESHMNADNSNPPIEPDGKVPNSSILFLKFQIGPKFR